MSARYRVGFSLMEVILAIGVLSLAILSLLGLFGPTMASVKNVMDRSAATGVMSQINAYLQTNAVTDASGDPLPLSEQVNFQNATQWARSGNVLYAWNRQVFDSATSLFGPVELRIAHDAAAVRADFENSNVNIEGSVFVAVLSRASLGFAYPYDDNELEGYVPVKVDIYVVDTDVVSDPQLFTVVADGNGLNETASSGISEADRVIDYTIAKVR